MGIASYGHIKLTLVIFKSVLSVGKFHTNLKIDFFPNQLCDMMSLGQLNMACLTSVLWVLLESV